MHRIVMRKDDAYLMLPREVVQAIEELRSDGDVVELLRVRGVEHALREYAWSVRPPHEKPGVLFQELLMFRELVERRFLAGSKSIHRGLLLSHIDRMLKDAEGSVVELPPLVVEPVAPAPSDADANSARIAELEKQLSATRKHRNLWRNAAQRHSANVTELEKTARHLREQCGKLDARARSATAYRKQVVEAQRRVAELEYERQRVSKAVAGGLRDETMMVGSLVWDVVGLKARADAAQADMKALREALDATRNALGISAFSAPEMMAYHASAVVARADAAEAKLAALGENPIRRGLVMRHLDASEYESVDLTLNAILAGREPGVAS